MKPKLIGRCLLVGAWLSHAAVGNPAPAAQPLKDVVPELTHLRSREEFVYKLTYRKRRGDQPEERGEYGSLRISTEPEGESLVLRDMISVPYSEEAPKPVKVEWRSQTRMKCPRNKLLHPEEITHDILVEGLPEELPRGRRLLSHAQGQTTTVDYFTGETNTRALKIDEGIVSYNALLRLLPLLPRETGRVYSFRQWADPFLFLIRELEEPHAVFTLSCEGPDRIEVGDKEQSCVRFCIRGPERSASSEGEAWTDFWVDGSGRVVKFVYAFADRIASGAVEGQLTTALHLDREEATRAPAPAPAGLPPPLGAPP